MMEIVDKFCLHSFHMLSTHNFLSYVGNSYPLLCLDISTLKLHHFVAYIGHLLSSSSKDDFRCKMVIIITCLSCVSPTYRNSYLTKNDFVNLFVQILLRDSITRDRFPHFLTVFSFQMENMYISRFLQHRKYRNKERITAHREGVWETERRERERGRDEVTPRPWDLVTATWPGRPKVPICSCQDNLALVNLCSPPCLRLMG